MELIRAEKAPQPAQEILERLRRYCGLLCAMNERVRLVGPRDEETLWKEHIEDCLHLRPLLPEKGTLVDVGTGGGLPGAVLALCRPDLSFTLLDSLSRKTNALAEILDQVGVPNAKVVCARSEDAAAQWREAFDCAVVRAVSEAGVIAEYLSPLVAPGGRLLAMKGSAVEEELATLLGLWSRMGLSEPEVQFYERADHRRYVVIWRKVLPCPPEFPRRPGRAEKKLWWR